ncbi:GlcG/HbpS family heme-binding protein [Paraburkholderia caribensis]|uniref:GlcG/HbpS family heme-binding protein n=1 Tax=Paraburkholderia caribensis TaxID=75105 RepID=UPI001590A421|nr:heme-binding protein [Paraburkholderia caribensis]
MKLRRPISILFALGISVAAGQLSAQTAGAQPSTSAIPEKVPFDTPYGVSLGVGDAMRAIDAARSEAATHGWPEAIAVTDISGGLVAFFKMDGAQNSSAEIAQRKASVSARYRRETRVFYNAMEGSHAYVATLEPGVVAAPGGYPLIVGGKVVGAIGCSGGTGDQDATVCAAGARVVR